MPVGVEPLRAEGDVAVGAERATRTCEMSVGEEVAKPGVRQVLLDAAANFFPPPLAARAIGAFRQPASRGRDAEQAPVLVLAHRELQPDAFVPAEEREVAVRGGGPDDLETTLLLEPAKGGDEICVDSPEQLPQAIESRPPEFHQRAERRRGFVAGSQTLAEELLHLAGEGGARQLVRQHRRESDRHGGRRLLGGQLLEPLQQGEIRVERGLAQPVAAVGPAAVIEDVREVTVERENELHRVPGQLEREVDRTARARAYSARYCSPERCQPNCWAIAPRTSFRHAVRSA